MATAKPQISKTQLLNPAKLSDEFGLSVIGDCLKGVLNDGEIAIINKKKPIRKGDLVCIFFKPEALTPGSMQCAIKRMVYNPPKWMKFPFVYDKERATELYGDFGPIIFVEMLNPPRTLTLDLRRVMGIYRADPCPQDVIPVKEAPPARAVLKKPTAAKVKKHHKTMEMA